MYVCWCIIYIFIHAYLLAQEVADIIHLDFVEKYHFFVQQLKLLF